MQKRRSEGTREQGRGGEQTPGVGRPQKPLGSCSLCVLELSQLPTGHFWLGRPPVTACTATSWVAGDAAGSWLLACHTPTWAVPVQLCGGLASSRQDLDYPLIKARGRRLRNSPQSQHLAWQRAACPPARITAICGPGALWNLGDGEEMKKAEVRTEPPVHRTVDPRGGEQCTSRPQHCVRAEDCARPLKRGAGIGYCDGKLPADPRTDVRGPGGHGRTLLPSTLVKAKPQHWGTRCFR